ncbi:MAG: PIN domain-containing protein [Ilumatobacteraceae bacterium]
MTAAATLRFECREVGHPLAAAIHANDLWIAASARHIDAPLVTADTVFREVPGLSILPA